MFIVYRLIQSRKHQRRYFILKDLLSSQYCREKTLHYLLSKTTGVQWLVSEIPEVTCAIVRAKYLSAQQHQTGGERKLRLGNLAGKEMEQSVRVQTGDQEFHFEDGSGDTF